MIKRLLWLLVLFVCVAPYASAQQGLQAYAITGTGAQARIVLIGSSITFHQLTWNVSGTVSGCTVALDSSADGVSWSAGNAIVGQSCTSNGQSAVSASSVFNYVRVNVTAFAGTGTVVVTWDGFVATPSSGGTFGPNYSVGGGTAQAQTVAPTTAVTNATLVNGYQICWLPNAANSGPAPTLAGSGTSTFSAKSITKYGTIALIANDIVTSTVACAVYDGTEFQLQMPKAGAIQTTSYQAVGAAAQAMNLYVSGGCDGISACTGFFWGLQAPASLAASLQYTPPIVDGLAGDGLTTDGSQHMAWAIQRRTLTGTAYTNATTGFTTVVGSAGQTLQFTVAASSNYKISCDIEWQGSANTTGPKWQWTGPASPTALVQYVHNPVTTSTYLDAVGSKTAFSSPMADTGTITAATDFVSHLDLELVNGVNAGTVVLQAAANGAGTLTIQPGSSCVSNGDK